MQETLHFDPVSGSLTPAALEGGGARLPLPARARPGAAGPDRGDARRGARGAARAAGWPAPRATSASSACRPRPPCCSPPTRRRPSTSSACAAAGGRRARVAPTGSPASWRRRCAQDGGEDRRGGLEGDARVAGEADRHGAGEADLARQRQDRARLARRRGRRPGRDRRARGPGADLRQLASSRRIVAAAIEADPEAAEQVRGGNQKAIGAIVGAVMRETKGRADGGEVEPPDPREARPVRPASRRPPSGKAAAPARDAHSASNPA